MRHLLAVWNDCSPAARADYERWYTQEHLPERISIPGFICGHRYEAHIGDRRYFTYYETESAATLHGEAYLRRLENPTDWTRRIMPAFTNALRTVCALTERRGRVAGAHVVTLRREAAHAGGALSALMARVAAEATRVQIWSATEAQTPPTAEARIRPGKDSRIREALVADFLRLDDAVAFAEALARDSDAQGEIGVYSHLCSLYREGLSL